MNVVVERVLVVVMVLVVVVTVIVVVQASAKGMTLPTGISFPLTSTGTIITPVVSAGSGTSLTVTVYSALLQPQLDFVTPFFVTVKKVPPPGPVIVSSLLTHLIK